MQIILIISSSIVFIGMAGAIIKKKGYKKILSISISFNALILLYAYVSKISGSKVIDLGIIIIYIFGYLFFLLGIYICHKIKGNNL